MSSRGEDDSTLASESDILQGRVGLTPGATRRVLVLVWSRDEPERVGELFAPPKGAHDQTFSIGRTSAPDEDGALSLPLVRLRPYSRVETGPLRGGRISRRQLRLHINAQGSWHVERVARSKLRINGAYVRTSELGLGDLIEVERRFSLLVATRPRRWPNDARECEDFPFGHADGHGLVGESTAAWTLRGHIAFVGPRGGHVLVHGPSGSGKELVVRALHRSSDRGATKLVSRNAATIPESLVDAELFGNLRNFPNPGTPERPGLFGQANHSTLFLDEIGELPVALQARLLRVMDQGEYQRLGEASARSTNARVVGATNRELTQLKHDVLARFFHRIRLPGLNSHLDDLPLLARHALTRIARGDPKLRSRFFAGQHPRISAELVAALVRRTYTTHVRELIELLWRSLRASRGELLELPPELRDEHAPAGAEELDDRPITRERVIDALERSDGVLERAWRRLGLRNRYQLHRLIKKFNIQR